MKFLRNLAKYVCCWPVKGKSGVRRSENKAKLLEQTCFYSHMRGQYSFADGEEDALLERIEAKCSEHKTRKRQGEGESNEMFDATDLLVEGLSKLCKLCRERESAEPSASGKSSLDRNRCCCWEDGTCLMSSKTQKLRNDLYRLGFELRLALDTLNTVEERLMCIELELQCRRQNEQRTPIWLSTISSGNSHVSVSTPRVSFSTTSDELSSISTCSLDTKADLPSTSSSNSISIVFSN